VCVGGVGGGGGGGGGGVRSEHVGSGGGGLKSTVLKLPSGSGRYTPEDRARNSTRTASFRAPLKGAVAPPKPPSTSRAPPKPPSTSITKKERDESYKRYREDQAKKLAVFQKNRSAASLAARLAAKEAKEAAKEAANKRLKTAKNG
jgi:hypothetical protein